MSMQLLPILEIYGPDGEEFRIELSKEHITIGRFHELNDVGLEPDPQMLVTRKAHCIVEREADMWWVIDNGSVNRTFVRRGGVMEAVEGRAPIQDSDTIMVLGRLAEDDDPAYWELIFRDPLKTRRAEGMHSSIYLEYDWLQAKLFRTEGGNRVEISSLPPQVHKLVRYMDQRNRANGGVPVLCTHDELIFAVWGDEVGHVEGEVNRLVFDLRQRLDDSAKEPKFVQSVKGLGYRLVTRPSKD